ncbi:MAG: N-acetylmuramoyl-L-alanine amidase [Pseudomonadota bacterium]
MLLSSHPNSAVPRRACLGRRERVQFGLAITSPTEREIVLVALLTKGLTVLVALLGLIAPAAANAVATGATFSEPSDATRFVLEFSGTAEHRVFVVDEPSRIVVDLDGLTFDISGPVPAAGLVTAWRYGALGPATGRIVFDLEAPALVARSFVLPELAGRPARLVIDLKQVSEARFDAAAEGAVASLDDPLPRPAKAAEFLVVIDPGHGGIDPGAVSEAGTMEKDLALQFSKRLRDDLSRIDGVDVRLTRSDDRFLSLNRRIRIARAYGADLFISIHADSAPQDYVQGATVYTLSERPSDAEAAALAARENLSDSVSGAVEPDVQEDVSGILADLMRRETKAFSHEFASTLVATMRPTVRMNSNPHRFARFRVLLAHDIPSVLLELGYLTNTDDARLLTDPAWQERASAAVTEAVARFFRAPRQPRQFGDARAATGTQGAAAAPQ